MRVNLVRRVCCLTICLMLATLGCVSCSCGPSWEEDEGYTLTPEQIEELSKEIFGTQPSSGEGEVTSTLTPEELTGIAYWLEGGTVYHLNRDCSHIRYKADVHTGTVADALEARKKKVCTVCDKWSRETEADIGVETETQTEIETETQTEIQSETSTETDVNTETHAETHAEEQLTVYWVKNGSVYHLSRDCSSLKKSTDIRSGTVEESGKPRACSRCG